MRAHRFVLHVVALSMLAVSERHAAAQDSAPSIPDVRSPESRVRCLDREACRLVEIAVAASATVARELACLQDSDLIVGLETEPFQKKTKGNTRILATTATVRHVRIRIRIPAPADELVWVLGHELHHAVELAAAPHVRDQATLRAHFLRIGFARMDDGYYETQAALETGRQVAREVAASGAARGPARVETQGRTGAARAPLRRIALTPVVSSR